MGAPAAVAAARAASAHRGRRAVAGGGGAENGGDGAEKGGDGAANGGAAAIGDAAANGSGEASGGAQANGGAAAAPTRPSCPTSCCFFVGVRFAPGAGEGDSGKRRLDLRPAATAFLQLANAWEGKAELCPSAKMFLRLTTRAQLPEALLRCAEALPFDDELDAAAIAGDGG